MSWFWVTELQHKLTGTYVTVLVVDSIYVKEDKDLSDRYDPNTGNSKSRNIWKPDWFVSEI